MPCSLAPLLLLPTLTLPPPASQVRVPVDALGRPKGIALVVMADTESKVRGGEGALGRPKGIALVVMADTESKVGEAIHGVGVLIIGVCRPGSICCPSPLGCMQARTASLENTLVLGRYIKLDLHAGAIKRSAGGGEGGGGGSSRGRISTAAAGGEGISPSAVGAGGGAISSGASRGRFLPPLSADSPTPWQQGQAGRWEGQSRQRRVVEGPADGALYRDPRRPDQPEGGPSSSADSIKVMALEAQQPPSTTTKTSAQKGTAVPARMLSSGSGAAAAEAEGAAAAAAGAAAAAAVAVVAGAAAGPNGVSPASRRQRGGYLRVATTPPDAVGPMEEEGLPFSPAPAAVTAAPVRQRGGYLRGGSGRPGGSFAQSRPQDPAA